MIELIYQGFAEEMEKLAGRGKGAGSGRPLGAKDTKPRKKPGEYTATPFQSKAIDKLLKNQGKLLVAHGTGTGKTFTSVRGFQKMKQQGTANRAIVITPASLKRNFIDKGVKKFTDASATEYKSVRGLKNKKPSEFNVVSYALFRRYPDLFMKAIQPDTMILDEVHKARNYKTKNYKSIMKERPKVRNVIAATASPVSNEPSEIIPLLDIVSGEQLPKIESKELLKKTVRYDPGREGFLGFFRKAPKFVPKESEWTERIQKYTDLVTVEDVGPKNMPVKAVEVEPIKMSDHQKRLFDYIMGDLGWWTRFKMRHNLPLDNDETKNVLVQIQKARAVSNGIHTVDPSVSVHESAKRTPKIVRLISDVKNHLKSVPDAQIVIYSNLINGGVDVIKAGLENEGIDYGLFIGKGNKGVTEAKRNQDVKDFNAGKKKVIILSGAGSEGLSFDNATFHASLDGHFNPEVIKQAEARSVRMGGLSHRPPEKRRVIVKRYMSVFPKSVFDKWFGKQIEQGIDERVYKKAWMKERINQIFREVMRGETEKAASARWRANV